MSKFTLFLVLGWLIQLSIFTRVSADDLETGIVMLFGLFTGAGVIALTHERNPPK